MNATIVSAVVRHVRWPRLVCLGQEASVNLRSNPQRGLASTVVCGLGYNDCSRRFFVVKEIS